ncbi:MAG: inorganic pyrophosphatase [Defluviitaleaceae bacterium]|nr:inorganic pyrophosphatase [Defluviitaleaceae bacterium]
MKEFNHTFWGAIDKLISESKIIIDRPKGSRHPKYPDYTYPLDYGYLENTASMDGGGIDIWKGTGGGYIDAIICTVDLFKKDSEIKILIGCTEEEKQLVVKAHNEGMQSGLLIRRDEQ